MLQLVIGNKNYSSWSMRPWVLMRQFGIAFDEIKLRFDFSPDSDFYRELARHTPAAKVPVLRVDGFAVWDTLAIAETLAERHPDLPLWPRNALQRARARSLCAEMHAGFGALRQHFPMNIEASLPAVGVRVMAEQPAVRADLVRIESMWAQQLDASGGPFLFGDFSIADAMYAPVAFRFATYGVALGPVEAAYVESLRRLPAMAEWADAAAAETEVEERYEVGR